MDEILVGDLDTLVSGQRLFVSRGGREIGVLAHQGEVFAFENRCLHQGGPVCEGVVNGRVEAILADDRSVIGERLSKSVYQLACPWHGWEYELSSGRCVTDPSRSLRTYATTVRDGKVFLIVDDDD